MIQCSEGQVSSTSTKIIGFSKTPTRYRMTSPAGDTFVRCGADLLLNGLGEDLKAEGRCPICNRPVKFKIIGQVVVDLRPRTAHLHVVEMRSASGRLGICCEDTHLFDREECQKQWLLEHTGRLGISTTPQKYLERLKVKLQSKAP